MHVQHLHIVPHGAGSVQWRIAAPAATSESVAWDSGLGLLLVALPALWRGVPLLTALALGLAASVCLALGRALLAVQSESVTYVRLLGVRLDTKRRCGFLGSSRFLGLRHLQGVLIHEEVSATRAGFYLALLLASEEDTETSVQHSDGSSTAGLRRRRSTGALAGIGGGNATKHLAAEGCDVAVVFPRLRPRLNLLRQVYQQLHPLLSADLETRQGTPPLADTGLKHSALQQQGGGGGEAQEQQAQEPRERRRARQQLEEESAARGS